MLDMGIVGVTFEVVRLAANGRTLLHAEQQDGETVWVGWDDEDGKWVAEIGEP